MKKIIVLLLVLAVFIPNKLSAQEDDAGIVAAVAATVAVIAAIVSIEVAKDRLEQFAVEQVMANYPYLTNFHLKTLSLNGTKLKDLSSVDIITYQITDIDTNKKYILFAFASPGWVNQYGLDFSKLIWRNFDKNKWNDLIRAYVKTASGIDLDLDEISKSKIVNNGVKKMGKFILKFEDIGRDIYLTFDYSNDFKIAYNKGSLGLFLKPTSDLMLISRKAIISAHRHVNSQ